MYNERLKSRVFEKLENALRIYERLIYSEVAELGDTKALYTHEYLRSVPESGMEPIEKGKSWGDEWGTLWVKGSFEVPESLSGKELFALSDCGGTEQLFFINGVPKGIYNSKNREYIGGVHCAQYIGKFNKGEKFDLAFECYAGHYDPDCNPYDYYFEPDSRQTFLHTFNGVKICVRNDDIFTLIFDIRELLNAARVLDEDNFVRSKARNILLEINAVLPLSPLDTDENELHEGVKKALGYSREFFKGKNDRLFGKVGVIGHSHMDTAWLWPVNETVRKCARTYSNALHLMEQYPDYKFIQSSALHSEWMKDYYPDIFEEMKKRVAEGRYEPNGGVFVECDCNITSGELMARQFLKGQQFTRENFGYTADSFWLPDTFGYNGNIPQIMQQSEVKYFYTTKIGWNDNNRFPFESFVWKGIDKSEVITHFNRTHCWPNVNDAVNDIRGLQDKDSSDMRLIAYGFGDGGGGPTPAMIEAAQRISNMDGMPEVESMTISDFMKELETKKDALPVYDDELYLELHRGTLTQMHEVKRKNRKAEYALRDMEYFNVLSGEKRNENSDKWLKVLLKNQFHDILPGTCIAPVYEVYHREMDELLNSYKDAANHYAEALTDESDCVTLFNTLSFDRNDVSDIAADGFARSYDSQRYTDMDGNERLAIGGLTIPAFSNALIELGDKPVSTVSPFNYDGNVLETPFVKITFDGNGYISSLIDKKSGRELRKKDGEPLGVFLFGEDVPESYDNWDLDWDVFENLKPAYGFIKREVVSDGAVEIRLRSGFNIGKNRIVQDMVCYASSPRIDFETKIEWNTPHRFLKAGFDLDITAKTARSEIQFGSIERPVTANNSLEVAKFEVCNRNYTDISEPRFGAAILNDCKYGISIRNCNLCLSLHKGGTHPDGSGDKGVHKLTYSLLVHNSGYCAEEVVQPAYELNIPAFAVKGKAELRQFASISKPNIIAEAVKPAEDDSNAFIVRLYECEGSKTNADICFSSPVSRAALTNILEDEKETAGITENSVSLCFEPFEIKTLKIYRQ
ncbi:MAG: alpha-mannosidase [Ruminococcaceae bacterium]|nr:alpha-mannosidase [Oscillospiraceae bacterium]